MRPPVPASPRAALTLGPGLRPIVFGAAAPASDGSYAGVRGKPELILSVHAPRGELLGYAVVDRAVSGSTWGRLTVSSCLSLDDACLLAQATTVQLSFFGLQRGSHHCLVCMPDELTDGERSLRVRGYLAALQPLLDAGLCQVVVGEAGGTWESELARKGLLASATATTIAVLEHLRGDARRATLALFQPTELARDVVAGLVNQGARLVAEGDDAPVAGADVLLVGGPLWKLTPRDAMRVRARAVVALGVISAGPAVERKLHQRGVLVLPDTITAAGQFLATELRARGLDELSAIARSSTAVDQRVRAVLWAAAERNEPVAAIVRASLDGAPES